MLLLICAFQLTGFSGTQYSHEVTEIDPTKKTMTLVTRNVGVFFLVTYSRMTVDNIGGMEKKREQKKGISEKLTSPLYVSLLLFGC